MKRFPSGLLLLWGCGLIGCTHDPLAGPGGPAHIQFDTQLIKVGYTDTASVKASLVDAAGIVIDGASITWSSSDSAVAVVESGIVEGRWPGVATLRAHARGVSDSVQVVVHTDPGCEGPRVYPEGHGFEGYWYEGPYLRNQSYVGTPLLFHGERLYLGSGILFGTGPDRLMRSRAGTGGYSNIFAPWACAVADSHGLHSVQLLQAPGHAQNEQSIPGLVAVQESFALQGSIHADYILVRLTFTNAGDTPIQNLVFGVTADFDIGTYTRNYVDLDLESGISYVVTEDTIKDSLSGALAVWGGEVLTHRYDYLARWETPLLWNTLVSGVAVPTRAGPMDIRQLMALEPMTIAPGETRAVGYVIAGGRGRAAVRRNVDTAREVSRWIGGRGLE